jgi:hypothetical protein
MDHEKKEPYTCGQDDQFCGSLAQSILSKALFRSRVIIAATVSTNWLGVDGKNGLCRVHGDGDNPGV